MGFQFKDYIDRKVIKSGSLYLVSLVDLTHEQFPIAIQKLDIVFQLSNKINIALINEHVIGNLFFDFEKSLGIDALKALIAQIRFTKWLLKQPLPVVDSYGTILNPIETDKICLRHGLVSVLIEYILINLSRKPKESVFSQMGSFDQFMKILYLIDLAYRTSSNQNENPQMVPLDIALNIPSLLNLRRDEVKKELDKLEPTGTLPSHLYSFDPRIFSAFKSEQKWYLLIKLVRDYFENEHFEQIYLNPKIPVWNP